MLKAEKHDTEIALATIAGAERQRNGTDLDQACAILDALPDLTTRLAAPTPSYRRIYQAFRLSIELDRNASLIRLKALVSSAFSKIKDLDDLAVAQPFIAGGALATASLTPSRPARTVKVVRWPRCS